MKFQVRVNGVSEKGEKLLVGESEIEAPDRGAAIQSAIEQLWDPRLESTGHSPEGEILSQAATSYLIYSKENDEAGDGAGFWNNDLGWVLFGEHTRFSEHERNTTVLPLSGSLGAPNDAQWLTQEEAEKKFGVQSE